MNIWYCVRYMYWAMWLPALAFNFPRQICCRIMNWVFFLQSEPSLRRMLRCLMMIDVKLWTLESRNALDLAENISSSLNRLLKTPGDSFTEDYPFPPDCFLDTVCGASLTTFSSTILFDYLSLCVRRLPCSWLLMFLKSRCGICTFFFGDTYWFSTISIYSEFNGTVPSLPLLDCGFSAGSLF